MSVINCSTNSKSFNAIYFFLQNSKVEVSSKNKSAVFSFPAFITRFQLLVGYVFKFTAFVPISVCEFFCAVCVVFEKLCFMVVDLNYVGLFPNWVFHSIRIKHSWHFNQYLSVDFQLIGCRVGYNFVGFST